MPHRDCPRCHVMKHEVTSDINLSINRLARNPSRFFSLNPLSIHRRLNISENQIRKTNPSIGNLNLVTADITFIVSVGDRENKNHQRKPVTFPIKVPSKAIFTFTDAKSILEKDLIDRGVDVENPINQLMERLYSCGAEKLGGDVCGQRPDYSINAHPSHGQYTHHSEQALYCYLHTRQAVRGLVNRLTAEIRGRDWASAGDEVKVYSAVLHIHSTKTPCGACETAMIGLHYSDLFPDDEIPGFLSLLQTELEGRQAEMINEVPPSVLQFTYPGRLQDDRAPAQKGVKLFTTYTANTHDQNHQKEMVGVVDSFDITEAENRKKVFVVNYEREYDENFLDERAEADLKQRTVFASASEISPNIRKARVRIDEVKENDEDRAFVGFNERCKVMGL